MQLIVVREAKDCRAREGASLVRYALSTTPLRGIVWEGLRRSWRLPKGDGLAAWVGWTGPEDFRWVLPRSWLPDLAGLPGGRIFDADALGGDPPERRAQCPHPWSVVTNGRFAAYVNHQLLDQMLATAQADVIAVTAATDLLACREHVRFTQDNALVGYRRLYEDSICPRPVPPDWPHHLLVRRAALDTVLGSGLASSFDVLVDRCRAAGLRLQSVAVAGSAFDLEWEEGLLALCRMMIPHILGSRTSPGVRHGREESTSRAENSISPAARLIGPVLLGGRIVVEAGAVVVGPAVLCDGSTVGPDAVIDSAIVGADAAVAPGHVVRDSILAPPLGKPVAARIGRWRPEQVSSSHRGLFRRWPWLSYARCFKRVADVVAATLILILFAPVIPVIAAAVKLSSPGPVFFRDKRQGLHGKPFYCFKFRTMSQGADKIQDKLRFVSEVDGPQFKIVDDPRITTVGQFLRETYLDEIPQFFNVLCGQMSVVGPRPSPESENTLCPSWRDARLSVRPGITGLWQVHRTRQPQRDFQEWIHYDTKYVRDFSFGLDLWICGRTLRRMLENFVRQF